jgi:hypothetical protein
VLYLAALFFQGGAGGGITGFINNLRQWLWIPVSQVGVGALGAIAARPSHAPRTAAAAAAASILSPAPSPALQDAYRRVSLEVFSHVLDLDL